MINTLHLFLYTNILFLLSCKNYYTSSCDTTRTTTKDSKEKNIIPGDINERIRQKWNVEIGERERERERENTTLENNINKYLFQNVLRILCLKLKNGKSEFKTHSSGVVALNHFL